MGLFDTHAHLLDRRFDADRVQVIEALQEKGVELMVEIACEREDFDKAIDLASKYPCIYATVGIHPHDAAKITDDDMYAIEKNLSHPRVIALGETGLDYHYDFSPRDVQRKWFDTQLKIAKKHDMPVVIHSREACADTLDILRANRDGLKGIVHCFSGSYETAKSYVDMGLYIAFGGALTFANATKQRQTASKLPIERLLIETDSPYITPVPHRGKRNDPTLVRHVCEEMAKLRDMDYYEMEKITCNNGKRAYGID